MQNTTHYSRLDHRAEVNSPENRDSTSYDATISLIMSGGLLCGFLGVLSFIIFTLSGGTNAVFNRAGMFLILIAAIGLGIGAHFMDKADDKKRRQRSRIEDLKEKEFIN